MAEPTCDYCGYPMASVTPVSLGGGKHAWRVHEECELDARVLFAQEDGVAIRVGGVVPRVEIDTACENTTTWLRGLPSWTTHPRNESGSVYAHAGPSILSEHDCVLQFARHLQEAGIPWEDLHMELSPGQWMFKAEPNVTRPPRIDLAVVPQQRLLSAHLPAAPGELRLTAAFEFALASNYWQMSGALSGAKTMREKVSADIEKVAGYVDRALVDLAYVVVVEECDHEFGSDLADKAVARGVHLRILRRWGAPSAKQS